MKRHVASIAIIVTPAAIVELLLIPVVVFVFFALMYFTHRIRYDKKFKV